MNFEYHSQRLFGLGAQTMLGALFLVVGGLWVGLAILASASAGWSFHELEYGAYAVVPLALGFTLLKR